MSYCAPGAPGRGTLATLIAAQRMVRELSVGFSSFLTAAPFVETYPTSGVIFFGRGQLRVERKESDDAVDSNLGKRIYIIFLDEF